MELLIVSTGALLVSLSQSVLVPVLAILPERLHTSTSNVEWLLTSTLLVEAVAVPLFGRMGDLFGKRRLLIVALAALAAGVRRGGRVDVPGAVVMSGALVALLLPLAQGNSWGWASARTLGLLGVFVALERRVSQPLVDLKATTRRPIVLTNLASLLFGFALFASLIGTASFVQAPAISGYGYGFGSSIVVAGLCLLPAACSCCCWPRSPRGSSGRSERIAR